MPSESFIHALRQRLDTETLMRELLPTLRGSGREREARCPFHDDHDPSMSVNVVDGLFYCHNPACGARGDVFTLVMRIESMTFPEAVEHLARRVGMEPPPRARRSAQDQQHRMERVLSSQRVSEDGGPVIPAAETENVVQIIDEAVVTTNHAALLNNPDALNWLLTQRGLTRETVVRWQLGHDGDRYYIPIRNEVGQCLNIRRYRADATVNKVISWRQGYGASRLWPMENVRQSDPVYLMEGEMDCLLALQGGLPAITTTGGAGAWRPTWNHFFIRRRVVICYDHDEAGDAGAVRIATALAGFALEVRIVRLPLTEPGGDYTDYIHGQGHSVAEFLALVEQTPSFVLPPNASPARLSADDLEPLERSLSEASEAKYYNKLLRIPVMVSGKTMAPFLIPRKLRLHCPNYKQYGFCKHCLVHNSMPPDTEGPAGDIEYTVDTSGSDVMDFVNVPTVQMMRQIKRTAGVPTKCPTVEYDIIEALNVEQIQLIPQIERKDQAGDYVTREAFFIPDEETPSLHANRDYKILARTIAEPKKQLATHLIYKAVPSQSNIDAFKLDSQKVANLRAFQPTSWTTDACWKQLHHIYDDLERWTHIYDRRALMIAVDLTYHSALSFSFQGEKLQRGWVETLILGDSRTGKSRVVQGLATHYGVGELTTGENTSLAGLVGGLQQIGTSWQLTWGRLPLNDRRLVVIDEAGNLPHSQIARMSSMRSSGVAEIIKIHTERTQARVRQIWISNPRSGRPLSAFSQGVRAVKELIGAAEDIARFDLVVPAATDDVPLHIVNAARVVEYPEHFVDTLCHQRVMWAWSRQLVNDTRVDWAPMAEAKVLEYAMLQGEKYRYATEVPLVEPNEQRIKLARLAVAAAAFFFSASDDGERLIVRPCHVEFVYEFLEQMYHAGALAFAEYAEMQQRRHVLSNPEEVERIVGRRTEAVRILLENESFTKQDIAEIFGYDDKDDLRAGITALRESGFLARYGSTNYYKTPAAIQWLRNKLNGPMGLPEPEPEPDEPPF